MQLSVDANQDSIRFQASLDGCVERLGSKPHPMLLFWVENSFRWPLGPLINVEPLPQVVKSKKWYTKELILLIPEHFENVKYKKYVFMFGYVSTYNLVISRIFLTAVLRTKDLEYYFLSSGFISENRKM